MNRLFAALLLFAPSLATASPALLPRDTARVGELGELSVGVFNPLRWAFAEDLELETHPLAFVVAPNATVRHEPWRGQLEPFALSFEVGLTLPWGAFRLTPPLGTKGFFTPSCAVRSAEPERGDTCEAPGLFLVPRAGVVLSHGRVNVFTARLDAATGVRLSGLRPDPLDAWPYLDLLLAPIFNGHRARLGVRYDHALLERLRVAAELSLYHVGRGPEPGRSPWVVNAWLGADLGITESMRLSAGLTYYNSDQRRVVLEKGADGFSRFVPARSHDLMPTVDLIWAFGETATTRAAGGEGS